MQFPLLHSRNLLFILSIYGCLHLLIPNSQSLPPPATCSFRTTGLFVCL